MSKKKKKGKKKFTQEVGSIDSSLSSMPKDIRQKYDKNRRTYDIDQRSLEQWASQGFSSGDETVHSDHEDMLG